MFGDTPLWMVEDAETLQRMVERLSGARVIGVDTESDSFYSYQEKVCLIQFSDLENDYIVDPLTIDDLSPLADILEDRSVVKIMHGADYDVVCLRRDFDFRIRNIFDTMIAAQMLGLERFGLADLILQYFGIEIDKQYQRHNWAKRPLEPEHLEYARGDTHFLLAIREIMLRKLKQVGRLRHVREEGRILEKRKWEGRAFDPDGWIRMKGAASLDADAKRVLRQLWIYRDEEAKKQNRPVFKTIPDRVLLDLAVRAPETERDLDRVLSGKSPMKRRYGRGMVAAVQKGLEDDAPVPKAPKKKVRKKPKTSLKARLSGRNAERTFNDLKEWRNKLVRRRDDLLPATVASNAVLQHIAKYRPKDLDELAQVPEVRRWQIEDFGEEILSVLDASAPLEKKKKTG